MAMPAGGSGGGGGASNASMYIQMAQAAFGGVFGALTARSNALAQASYVTNQAAIESTDINFAIKMRNMQQLQSITAGNQRILETVNEGKTMQSAQMVAGIANGMYRGMGSFDNFINDTITKTKDAISTISYNTNQQAQAAAAQSELDSLAANMNINVAEIEAKQIKEAGAINTWTSLLGFGNAASSIVGNYYSSNAMAQMQAQNNSTYMPSSGGTN
jgi:hypothetical protein